MQSSLSPAHVPLVTRVQHHAPRLCVSLGSIDLPLYGREEIVIVVDPGWRGEISPLDIDSWIANPATLGPYLMAFGAWEGARGR